MTERPRILIATSNRGKAREFAELLPFDAELVTLADLDLHPPDEPGETFLENATAKALAGTRASGLITIADDSGLCVDALDGAPGIHSARYSGAEATDASNRRKLLERLAGVQPEHRSAFFEAAVVVAYDNKVIAHGSGRTYGAIFDRERGVYGFGYDSIFLLPDGRTMAELPPIEKNEISHRARAVAQVIPDLVELIAALTASKGGRSP